MHARARYIGKGRQVVRVQATCKMQVYGTSYSSKPIVVHYGGNSRAVCAGYVL